MSFSNATRARFVNGRLDEAQTILRDALRESERMQGGGEADELCVALDFTLASLADLRVITTSLEAE